MLYKRVYFIAITNPSYSIDLLTGLLTIIC